ncbi:hypothetical protein I3843_10G046800 [Carya illinoinensis]|uniref:Alpha 1,4-glycosyltransferase domain-containing protein n=1 Tax=Carya illinoinensis TaxID=32201 RepID=A0A922DVE6_CARIL|nr:hypothetical protein I3842_10G045900 [Carya illinoinensis]KAG7958953.1 hypothetical protein I3843_10G046800 [Carya illinoinensis]
MYECPVKPSEPEPFLLFLLRQLQGLKRYVLAHLLCLPTSLFALILLLLLIYNGFSVFYLHLPFPAKSPAVPANFSPGNTAGESMKKGSSFSSSSYSSKLAASEMYATKEEKLSVILKTQSPLLRRSRFSILPITNSSISRPRRARKHKRKLKSVPSEARPTPFSARIENFFAGNSTASCAQTIDHETGNWSRLNNAVLIFDKNHPLLYKFIEEFALTFDGNKWGHNGPYLVSRVVSRLSGKPGFNFTVLLPSAFYPVDWSRIRSLFRGPGDELHSKWLLKKLRQIQSRSLVVHLWNRQSRKLEVEKGSIISHIVSDSCIFCNSALSSL